MLFDQWIPALPSRCINQANEPSQNDDYVQFRTEKMALQFKMYYNYVNTQPVLIR
jgi:hypothetical protein